jgi:hypothetical protein
MENSIYNIKYWDIMLRQNSETAKMISDIRWNFVKEINPKIVLDYGSGPGWFRCYAPKGIEVDTFDTAPWPQTGLRHDRYDLITFWDVIEHFKDLDKELKILLHHANVIALTVPIKPKRQDLSTWKHYKPNEHFQYFTDQSLDKILNDYGFQRIKYGNIECPPRTDITSYLYKRNA